MEANIRKFLTVYCLDMCKDEAIGYIKNKFKVNITKIEKVYNTWRSWVMGLKYGQWQLLEAYRKKHKEYAKSPNDFMGYCKYYAAGRNLEIDTVVAVAKLILLGATKKQIDAHYKIDYRYIQGLREMLVYKGFMKKKTVNRNIKVEKKECGTMEIYVGQTFYYNTYKYEVVKKDFFGQIIICKRYFSERVELIDLDREVVEKCLEVIN